MLISGEELIAPTFHFGTSFGFDVFGKRMEASVSYKYNGLKYMYEYGGLSPQVYFQDYKNATFKQHSIEVGFSLFI